MPQYLKIDITFPIHKTSIGIILVLYFVHQFPGGWFMVFNATFNNISVISLQSVLLVEETGENHHPVTSHGRTLSHNEYICLSRARTHNLNSGDRYQFTIFLYAQDQKKNMFVYSDMSKKSRVGLSVGINFFFFFLLSAKPEIAVPGSGIRYYIFEISGKPSFVEAVL